MSDKSIGESPSPTGQASLKLSDTELMDHELVDSTHGGQKSSRSGCVGPGREANHLCGRPIKVRATALCRTHHDQMNTRGWLGPIQQRLGPLTDMQCTGPGRDGEERCDRKIESKETRLCGPHAKQHRTTGVLKPIRRTNVPPGPCVGPGLNGELCGLPMHNKANQLCGGHYGQFNRQQELKPLVQRRKRGESATCSFTGCRYQDAPDGGGLCHHHRRQRLEGKELSPLRGNRNRGKSVLDRDARGNKLCPTCNEWKPELEFSSSSSSRDGFNHRCRRCHASAMKMLRYGIDIDEYDEMVEAQGGGCAICRAPLDAAGVRFAIDHDHTCCAGEVSCGDCIRGILCPNCNRGLGLFKDDIQQLRMAIAYLSMNDRSGRRNAS